MSVTVLPTSAVQLLPEQLEPAVPSLAATDPSADGEALPVTVPWAITTGVKVAVSESGFSVVEAPALIVHVALVPADAPHVPPVQPANVKLLLAGLAVSVTVSVARALHVTVVPAGLQLPLVIVPLIVPPVPPATLAVMVDPVASAAVASGTDRR